MKILFYGAGVMGSLYAARLKESGQDVSILARGQRLVDIREHGIVLEDVSTGKRTTSLEMRWQSWCIRHTTWVRFGKLFAHYTNPNIKRNLHEVNDD